jgi:hypothetical protein
LSDAIQGIRPRIRGSPNNHQFSASDKAAVIGGQEDHSLGDLIGLTHPPERDLSRHLRSELRDLLIERLPSRYP